ncbi:hypothetical protein AHAS_Ahas14G0074600 [Arachis hypogaea]
MVKKVEKPIRDHIIGIEEIRATLLQQLCETNRCRDILRMSPHAFLELCTKLRATGHKHFIFLPRSRETISRNFYAVLKAVISLEEEFLQQPFGTTIPSEILHSNRFYPYFKDCIGAIDGTHVKVKVPIADQPRFCGKFYLGDAEFMLKHTRITPYRSVTYHLKEFAGREPENAYELFNLRGTEPYYDVEIMVDIALACIMLHNILMAVDRDQH